MVEKTYFMFLKMFPRNHSVYEIMWIIMIQPGRAQITIEYGAWVLQAL